MPALGNGFSPLLEMQGAVMKGADGGYYLEVALKNNGNDPISISAIKLPWAPDHWDSWIKGFKLDAKNTQLEPGGALIDFGGQIIIKQKDSLKGKVALHVMFRTLLDDIDAHGVAIEWRCPTDLVPVACSTQTSRFLISKTAIQEEKSKASIPPAR